uniref:NADH-ubiquinone oxidoreductase chain 5 n=1 Tax=Pelagomacellicephala iliffei TaxID=1960706 RepID=A0A8E7IUT7_9ANNE|nr:NADH dehydrogenase subunit 5 [Pelagomacellicephala iliffei]
MFLPPMSAVMLLLFLLPLPSLLSLYLFSSNTFMIFSWTMFSSTSCSFSLPLILDPSGCLFSSTVLFISANVIFFSKFYMQSDKFIPRFTFIIMMFVASMNLLIFIPNLICLLLGWDGLGIVSFILVIYYQNSKSLAAGMITALMNRIGDVMILMSIAILLNLGHWSILTLWQDNSLKIFSIMILIAGMTKSAQVPFSSWLPAAMAAPTPVSALVHSSTLVTAGVFLLYRFHPTLSFFPLYCSTLLIIATITMLMAGMSALTECDMKKIVALSTLSQLGVMMSSLGMNMPSLTFFHLITHALFKALLFLTVGVMINYHYHSQDLRTMGNLILSSPLTISSLLIANLSLCGSPFFAGFYSKDFIIEMSLHSPLNNIILFSYLLATILTASYSTRMTMTLIWNSSNNTPLQYSSNFNSSMTLPMMFLTFGAITCGTLLSWSSFNNLLEPPLPTNLKLLPLYLTLLGGGLSYILISNIPLTSLSHHFISSMWFLTPLTSQALLNPPLSFSLSSLKILDNGWLEILSSQGIFLTLSYNSNFLMYMSKTKYTTHLSLFLISTLTLLI